MLVYQRVKLLTDHQPKGVLNTALSPNLHGPAAPAFPGPRMDAVPFLHLTGDAAVNSGAVPLKIRRIIPLT